VSDACRHFLEVLGQHERRQVARQHLAVRHEDRRRAPDVEVPAERIVPGHRVVCTRLGLELLTELGVRERIVPVVGAPDFLRFRPGLRVRAGTRVEEIPHADAEAVVLGDLAMEPAAIPAVHVREHRDRVLGILGPEYEHVALGNRRDELRAGLAAMLLREIVVRGKVVEIAADGVLAVRADVRNVSAAA